jgi:hypothetical protein
VPLEIVRLPVREGTEDEVVAYLEGDPYFGQSGLLSHRILVGSDEPQIALILEWESRELSHAAIATEIGQTFLSGLQPKLAGAPELTFYEPR